MKLRKLTLKNIKLFEDFELDLCDAKGNPRQWTLLVGRNGRGKTTILQTIALGHKPGHRTSPPSPLSDTERGSRTCFSVGVPPFPRREGGTGGLGLWPDP